MRYAFYTADVFTETIFGGNPLAIFPDAVGLTGPQMQKVAAEINYSETVFVFPPATPNGTKRLRIFTPKAEIPFAGHPTVGTAFVLVAIAAIPRTGPEMTLYFEEGVGIIPVKVLWENDQPVYSELTAAQLPEIGPEPPPVHILAEILSLKPGQILTGEYAPQALSSGLPFLLIPLRDQSAIAAVKLRRELWQQYLSSFWASSVYVFTFDTSSRLIDLRARMFAPNLGIEEDPATGSAATVLGAYLAQRDYQMCRQPGQERLLTWQVEQGIEMGRPSLLKIQVTQSADSIEKITVGGSSVLVSQGMMEIPVF
jgi:trans-2,3-dihydro-3-hydroxyanthranilate isomerase